MTTSFAASGEEAIARVIHLEHNEKHDDLDAFYDIQRTAEDIVRGDFKRIALQFPDELLHDSVPIYRRLKDLIGPGRELYVLADTSYGSCCVDEVAASHVEADAMVHYGHACLSLTSRLPVIYVFGKKFIDIDDCVAQLVRVFEENTTKESPRVLLKHDVVYTHLAEQLFQKLSQALEPRQIPVIYDRISVSTVSKGVAQPLTQEPSSSEPQPPSQASSISIPISSPSPSSSSSSPPQSQPDSTPTQNDDAEETQQPRYTMIFYVGPESLGLTNLLMTNAECDVYTYDPSTRSARPDSARTNRLLMRRYATLQKARDADVVGILVGTLGVASYLPLLAHLRKLLARAQKKSYTISVGKLNPAKLANFLEIECFVMVACRENSVVEDKEFLRPIVTPYELEIALRPEQTWTGRYVLDFATLLEEDAGEEENTVTKDDGEDAEEDDPDQPVFSLITGKYRHAKRYGPASGGDDASTLKDGETTDAMVLRNQENALARVGESAAAQFLQQRTYQGLEMRLGEDTPGVLEQGRSGIARGYRSAGGDGLEDT